VRALSGKPLEIVDQNGVKVLRVVGENTAASNESKPVTQGQDHGGAGTSGGSSQDAGAKATTPKPPGADHAGEPSHHARTEATAQKPAGADATREPAHHAGYGAAAPKPAVAEPTAAAAADERWLADLEAGLTAEEHAKLGKMKSGKTPQQMREMLGTDLDAARERVRAAVRADQERAAVAAKSKERVADLRRQIAENKLMDAPDVRAIVEGATSENWAERVPMLRDKLVAKILRTETAHSHPGAEVLDAVKIYEKLPEANIDEWSAKNPDKKRNGLTDRAGELYMQRGEIDIMVIERQATGKAKVIAREEVKTGMRDSNADARGQLDDQTELLRDAAAGKTTIRLEVGKHDIAPEIDLTSDATAAKSTRGPAGKGFDKSLGVSAGDLEALCKDLLDEAAAAGREAP
jgi:hypothetical protein